MKAMAMSVLFIAVAFFAATYFIAPQKEAKTTVIEDTVENTMSSSEHTSQIPL